mmetsp:Transcript_24965/g.63485  ORF Transcript_24965/g.63485 Transcript_24965/m.63485 type:complete len:214 (+) Transcript_24965:36-677(+)
MHIPHPHCFGIGIPSTRNARNQPFPNPALLGVLRTSCAPSPERRSSQAKGSEVQGDCKRSGKGKSIARKCQIHSEMGKRKTLASSWNIRPRLCSLASLCPQTENGPKSHGKRPTRCKVRDLKSNCPNRLRGQGWCVRDLLQRQPKMAPETAPSRRTSSEATSANGRRRRRLCCIVRRARMCSIGGPRNFAWKAANGAKTVGEPRATRHLRIDG